MRFIELPLAGAFLIELERREDERGFFARTFDEAELAAHGIPIHFPQSNLSRNSRAGTLRGMHFSVAPSKESKIVSCAAGAIHDVIVDLRPESPSYRRYTHAQLTARDGNALFVPVGFAHGFLTLVDDTDVVYRMGDVYRPDTARGFRWNDPAFGIEWPRDIAVIAERDASYPDYADQ